MSAAKMKPPVGKKNTPKARGKHVGSKIFTKYKKIEREPTSGKSGFFSRKDKTLKKLREEVKNSILLEDMHNSSLINKVVTSIQRQI